MRIQEHLTTQPQSTTSSAQRKPSRRLLQHLGFLAGAGFGVYIGYEWVDAAFFLSRAGALDYVVSQHPHLTEIACAAVGAVFGKGVGKGIEDLTAPARYQLGRMRDHAFGIHRNER